MVLSLVVITMIPISVFLACRSSTDVDNSAVGKLNLYRYLGKWYEIARFDHGFERDLDQCIATYSLQENGTIRVTNQGRNKKGEWKTSVGKGKVTKAPGILRVSFFGPFYSDYRIMMVAPDYSYALVGSTNDKYLWILARTPRLDNPTRNLIVEEARSRGYDTKKLIWVSQEDT